MNEAASLKSVLDGAIEFLLEAGATFALIRTDTAERFAGVTGDHRNLDGAEGVTIEWIGQVPERAVSYALSSVAAFADIQHRLGSQRRLLERLADITSMPTALGSQEAIQAVADRARQGLSVSHLSLEVRADSDIIRAKSGSGNGDPERLVTIPTRNAHTTMTIPIKPGDGLLDLIHLVGAHLATAIDNALSHEQSLHQARIEEEYEIASRVQQAVFTHRPIPVVPGYTIDAVARPARIVGGDFYEFLKTGTDRTLVVVGDVSGKGLPAAILTSLALSTIRAKAEFLPNPSPEMVLARAAEDLYQPFTDVSMFTTAVVATMDDRTFRAANAGHGLVIRRAWGKPPEVLGSTDPPIGVLKEIEGGTVTVPVDPGDVIIIISDGIIDQRSDWGEPFGLSGLLALIESGEEMSAKGWVDRLLVAVDDHAHGRDRDDDQTVVALAADYDGVERFRMQSTLEGLRVLPGHLSRWIDDAGLLKRVELATHELCVNAITHGSSEGEIDVLLWRGPSRLGIEVSSDGAAFDSSEPTSMPGEPTVHGYGLGLIHALADEVVYVRRQRNRTRMFFGL